MKKYIFALAILAVPFVVFAERDTLPSQDEKTIYCSTECEVVTPQVASLGGVFRMGGCRDPKAQNYEKYATYDAGECTYADGTKVSADSSDIIRDPQGVPTGGTHSALQRAMQEYRAVPPFFMSQGFVGNTIRLTPDSIQNALKTLTCQQNLLETTLSTRTPLGSDNVKRLQKFLRERSGNQVLITGNYRAQTTRAVLAFQREHMKLGTYTRGVVDVATRDRINHLECQALFGEYLNQGR